MPRTSKRPNQIAEQMYGVPLLSHALDIFELVQSKIPAHWRRFILECFIQEIVAVLVAVVE